MKGTEALSLLTTHNSRLCKVSGFMFSRCVSSRSLRTLTAASRPVLVARYPSPALPTRQALILPSSSCIRCYSSTTPRPGIFKDERDADWDMLRTGDPLEDDDNAHLKDWELAVQRTCDIIDEVTEKQHHKTLHIYCQPDFVTALGKRNIFSIGGCTDDGAMFEATKDMQQYQDSVQMIDFSKPLPYRHQSHQLVVCLCPPHRHDILPMSEVSRILNYEGFAVIGATGKMWKDNNLLEQLEGLSEHINILSLQTTELNDVKALYYMALIRAH